MSAMEKECDINSLVKTVEDINHSYIQKKVRMFMNHSYEYPSAHLIKQLCKKKQYSVVLEQLINDKKIDANYSYVEDEREYCLLINAICYGCKQAVKVLINNKVNLNVVACDPRDRIQQKISTLNGAIERIAAGKKATLLELLLKHGANPNYCDNTDLPLRHVIELCPHGKDLKTIEECTSVHKIRSNSDLSSAKDQEKHLEKCRTVRSNMLKVIRLLLEAGADPNMVCQRGIINPCAKSLAAAYAKEGDEEIDQILITSAQKSKNTLDFKANS